MFHRVGWMVRDPTATGRKRMMSEIGAMVLDPITGVNRFISGDASRVSPKPGDLTPSTLTGYASAGVLWRTDEGGELTESGAVFLEAEMLYGGSDTVPPYTSKALSVVYGGGWVFRHDRRVGLQLYGTHHAIALGDLQTSTQNAENIMGNLWSAGAAIVIR